MIGIALSSLGTAFAIVLGLITHLVPVIYHLCIFFERYVVFWVAQATGRRFSVGGLVLVSLLIWGALGTGLGAMFLSTSLGISALLIPGIIAAAWGASVGYQAAVQEVAHRLRRPGALEHHQPDYLGSQDRAAGNQPPTVSMDELWRDGIILGEAREQQRRR